MSSSARRGRSSSSIVSSNGLLDRKQARLLGQGARALDAVDRAVARRHHQPVTRVVRRAVRGQRSAAIANASCAASSARSKSPRKPIRDASTRPHWSRKTWSRPVTTPRWGGSRWRRPCWRPGPRRHLDRGVEIVGLEEEVAAEGLLGLDERAVGGEGLAVVDAHRGRGLGRLHLQARGDPGGLVERLVGRVDAFFWSSRGLPGGEPGSGVVPWWISSMYFIGASFVAWSPIRQAGVAEIDSVFAILVPCLIPHARCSASRVALVTGVSRREGIGFAVARRLAELGASIAIQGLPRHDEEQHGLSTAGVVDAVIDELRAVDPDVCFLEADFAEASAAAHVVAAAVRCPREARHPRREPRAQRLGVARRRDGHRARSLVRGQHARLDPARPGVRGAASGSPGRPHHPADERSGGSAMPSELAYAVSKGAIKQVTLMLAARPYAAWHHGEHREPGAELTRAGQMPPRAARSNKPCPAGAGELRPTRPT